MHSVVPAPAVAVCSPLVRPPRVGCRNVTTRQLHSRCYSHNNNNNNCGAKNLRGSSRQLRGACVAYKRRQRPLHRAAVGPRASQIELQTSVEEMPADPTESLIAEHVNPGVREKKVVVLGKGQTEQELYDVTE